jgi:hypothetical protein
MGQPNYQSGRINMLDKDYIKVLVAALGLPTAATTVQSILASAPVASLPWLTTGNALVAKGFYDVINKHGPNLVNTIEEANSDEQGSAPGNLTGVSLSVPEGTRTINGSTGEMVFREYRIVALSSYTSNDGYDGVLFYGSSVLNPFGYVKFTGPSTYTITRLSSSPTSTSNNWVTLSDCTLAVSVIPSLQQDSASTALHPSLRRDNCVCFILFKAKPGIEPSLTPTRLAIIIAQTTLPLEYTG